MVSQNPLWNGRVSRAQQIRKLRSFLVFYPAINLQSSQRKVSGWQMFVCCPFVLDLCFLKPGTVWRPRINMQHREGYNSTIWLPRFGVWSDGVCWWPLVLGRYELLSTLSWLNGHWLRLLQACWGRHWDCLLSGQQRQVVFVDRHILTVQLCLCPAVCVMEDCQDEKELLTPKSRRNTFWHRVVKCGFNSKMVTYGASV